MKIALHHRPDSFSSYWIKYFESHNIEYKIVNCYSTDIIKDIEDCDIFMWHWPQWHSRDVLFAKQLLYSIECLGIKVYPNIRTCFMFDDKVGQKYLSEALKIPLAKSYIFYYKEDAINWIEQTEFPKVFKLRGGASAANVKLAKNKSQALRLTKKAFGKGFATIDRLSILKDRRRAFRKRKSLSTFINLCKSYFRVIYPKFHERARSKEKNYIYFQEFIPGCEYDIRVVVVGNKAFAIKRFTRDNDFRASGSGIKDFKPESFNPEIIKLAFEINNKLKMQSVAFDFVEKNHNIYLIEFSYIWATDSFGMHPGYWNNALEWIEGHFCPADFIIEEIMKIP